MAEAGRSSRFLQPPPRPLRQLVQPVFLTPYLQTPHLLVARRRIAQLRERNPQLRRPAKRIDARLHFPHRIPRFVATATESWDPVWEVQTSIDSLGWTAEGFTVKK